MICPKNYFYERVKEKNFLESQIFRNPFFQGIWMVKPDCFLENSRLWSGDSWKSNSPMVPKKKLPLPSVRTSACEAKTNFWITQDAMSILLWLQEK